MPNLKWNFSTDNVRVHNLFQPYNSSPNGDQGMGLSATSLPLFSFVGYVI